MGARESQKNLEDIIIEKV